MCMLSAEAGVKKDMKSNSFFTLQKYIYLLFIQDNFSYKQ